MTNIEAIKQFVKGTTKFSVSDVSSNTDCGGCIVAKVLKRLPTDLLRTYH